MASAEGPARAHDRHARRRPFTSWMKRLASLKSLHTDSSHSNPLRPSNSATVKGKKTSVSKHNPYSFTRSDSHNNGPQRSRSRHSSLSYNKHSASISHDSQTHQKSRAPTLATTAETIISDTGRSGAGTTVTAARTEDDRDSTFSSPAQSLRSMTTTLTTMQSTAPAAVQHQNPAPATNNAYQIQPAPALPAHLAPHSHPTTYHSATANNVLSDDASMLTLASSSKRRRRNSVDTNASVKALAPASMFGGSRESLPLSVLSGTIISPQNMADNASLRETGSYYAPRSASALNAERASLISASGITAPALASERNSYISSKPVGDGGSIRSNFMSHTIADRDGSRPERLPLHGRNDSLGAGSLGGLSIGTRELMREREREREMVTAPTSPMPV